jgi:hypothetical protein
MGKHLWPQYKGLIDTEGLETKIPRDSGPPQTDKKNGRLIIYTLPAVSQCLYKKRSLMYLFCQRDEIIIIIPIQ